MVKVANTKPVDDVATEDAALSIVGFSVVCALVAAMGDSVHFGIGAPTGAPVDATSGKLVLSAGDGTGSSVDSTSGDVPSSETASVAVALNTSLRMVSN